MTDHQCGSCNDAGCTGLCKAVNGKGMGMVNRETTIEQKRKPIPRAPTYNADQIEELADAVYRALLGPLDVAAMLEKDKDGGQKLRRRAQAYAHIIRATLDVLKEMENG